MVRVEKKLERIIKQLDKLADQQFKLGHDTGATFNIKLSDELSEISTKVYKLKMRFRQRESNLYIDPSLFKDVFE